YRAATRARNPCLATPRPSASSPRPGARRACRSCLPARAVAAGRGSVGFLERTGPVASALLGCGSVRRRLGGTDALDSVQRGPPACDRSEYGRTRRTRALHRADGRRLAAVRCGLRALRRDQPGDPAELPEL